MRVQCLAFACCFPGDQPKLLEVLLVPCDSTHVSLHVNFKLGMVYGLDCVVSVDVIG